MAEGFPILESLAIDYHSHRLNDQMKVWFFREVGSKDCFTKDMRDQCSLVRADMEKRSQLMSELERLAVGEVAAEYLESLRQMQKRDGQKLLLLKELLLQARVDTHESVGMYGREAVVCHWVWTMVATMWLRIFLRHFYVADTTFPVAPSVRADGDASLFFAVAGLIEEVCCRISAGEGVTVSGAGKVRSGCAIGLKMASKVKSGFTGLDLLPKCQGQSCTFLVFVVPVFSRQFLVLLPVMFVDEVLNVNYTPSTSGSGGIPSDNGIANVSFPLSVAFRIGLLVSTMVLQSGIHKLSGICTLKVSSLSVSFGSPILPSPIFKSHVEKARAQTFSSSVIPGWVNHMFCVCLKSPPSIMLLPPNNIFGSSKISGRQRSRDSKQQRLLGISSDISFQNGCHKFIGSDTSQKIRIWTNSFLSSNDVAERAASWKARTHSSSPPRRPSAWHAALFVGYIVPSTKVIMGEREIDNLTMEQYLALTRRNQAPGVNDDAHEHVERVLDIVSLFNIPGVSHNAVMLLVFPITLTGAAKRLVDRLPPVIVDSWDLLKKAFIQRYCPPSKTVKQLEEIRNFKQEGYETLYQAWEWYNDLLYKCPTLDINIYQKTMTDHSQKWHDRSSSRMIKSSSIFEGIIAIVNKLENLDRDMKKLKENVYAIQVGCQICEGAHLDKDYPLNEEVKSVEEVKYGDFGRPFPNHNRNYGRFNKGGYDQPSSGERRPSLTEIINKYMEEACKRHAEQEEWLKKFYQSTETSQEAHDKIIQGLEIKEIEYFSANSGFSDNEKYETDNSGMAEALAALEATLKIKKEEPKEEKQSVNYYVDPYEPPIPFLIRLEHHVGEALVHKNIESLKKIKINRIDPDIYSYEIDIQESYKEIVYGITEVEKEKYSAPSEKRVHWCKAIFQEKENERQYWAPCNLNSNVCDRGDVPINVEKYYWESINDSKREKLEWENLSLNDLMKIRYGKVCKMTRERILKDHWRERFEDEEDDLEENLEDPEECG
ncbi:protein kinase-like domain, concanavalin A-like lectin/glucanase domain protein, partial [Tanacetum coccineum]